MRTFSGNCPDSYSLLLERICTLPLFEMDVLAGGLWHGRQRQEDGTCKTSLGNTEALPQKTQIRAWGWPVSEVLALHESLSWGFQHPGLRRWRQVDPGSSLSSQSSQTSELRLQWGTWLQKVTRRSWRHGSMVKTLTALPGDQGSIPSTYRSAHNPL